MTPVFKFKKFFLSAFLFAALVVFAVLGPAAFAQIDCPEGTNLVNGLCVPDSPFQGPDAIAGSTSVTELVLRVLKVLLTVSGVIAVLAIVVGGFWYLTSGGNEEQAEKGKKALINSSIGMVIVLLAYAVVTIITDTLTSGAGG